MEELQTDTLCDYGKKHQDGADNETSKDTENAANLLNGCEEIDDPLDLMDHCDESIGSNSDVWKGSDSEDESLENKDNEGNVESEKNAQINTNVNEDNPEVKAKEDQLEQERPEPITENGDPHKISSDGTLKDNDEIHNDSVIEKSKEDSKEADNDEKSVCESEGAGESERMDDQEKSNADNFDGEKISEHSGNDGDGVDTTIKDIEQDPLGESSQEDPLGDSPGTTKETQKSNEGQDDESHMDYDADEDDDFDPSLLCPEVSMAVDENPVITTSGGGNDGDEGPVCFEPYTDEVTGADVSFNLTLEEVEFRKRLYGPTNPVQMTRLHCTACNLHLGSALEGQNNRFVHPLLKVLICKKCYHFYTSGEFEKDEDGSELYCRWCGQGGQVLCCSKCEYVFCKRCIRNNFGRKKMAEIKESDSWDCFRCSTSQISTQRIVCYELFEYVRREMPRASTLQSPEIWAKDYSRCCSNKKRAPGEEPPVKKPKKRKIQVDPDYNPLADQNVPTPTESNSSNVQPIQKVIVPSGSIKVVPTFANKSKDNDIEFVRHIPASQVVFSAVRAGVPVPVGTSTPMRPINAMQTYRTILPSGQARPVLQPPTLLRINAQQVQPLIPSSNRILGNALQNRPANNPNLMKHEWFEKTVRAAARVNSHLSYTLTQLNKAQSQAASVEELAVVHNKLQEILSSSINSLIQIRKNLRNEFIAGIKTVRLPSKKVDTFANDDDVIFVSEPAPASAAPSASTSQTENAVTVGTSATASSNSTAPAKGYLKVKSINDLQNVPPECITIPDDPPSAPLPEPEAKANDKALPKVVCNGDTNAEETTGSENDTASSKPVEEEQKERSNTATEAETKKSDTATEAETKKSNTLTKEETSESKDDNHGILDIAEFSDNKLKMSVIVKVDRVDLEILQKSLHNESK